MKNIAICVPSGSMVHAGFMTSLFELTRYCHMTPPDMERYSLRLLNVQTSLLPLSRTSLVKYALANAADYILFIDSDMTFPRNTLHQLLSHNAPVVGTVASRRDGTGISVLYGPEVPREGVVAVDRLGTGLLLLDARIFDTLPKPWFDVTMSAETLPAPEFDRECEGEDIYLSYKLREAGYTLLLDWTLSMQIGHIGQMEYRLQK